MIVPLLIALQSAPAAAPPPASGPQPEAAPSQRWSILVPTPSEPCSPSRVPDAKGDEVVVCADTQALRLPDPDSVPSKGPMKSNPDLNGAGALAAAETPCAISGCVVGFGPPIVPLVKGAIDVAKRIVRKKPDKTGRVPIALDDPPPVGHLEP